MTTEDSRAGLLTAIDRRFRAEFGGDGHRCFFAPGRINLLGAHLDYSGGDVLPMAIDRGLYVAARLRSDGKLRFVSLDQDRRVEVDAAEVGQHALPEHGWGGYLLGVWQGFRQRTDCDSGLEMVVGSDLAMASGLASSAAIEVVTGIALDALHGVGLTRQEIAMIAHGAETGFVGLRCGIMDQFASALARPGHVLLLHCGGPNFEHVPFDAEACEVLVLDTRKSRELSQSGFNERVAECAAAHEVLRNHVRDLPHLAYYSHEDLERGGPALSDVLQRRARHVVSEMARMREGVAALRRHDYECLGAQLDASHASVRGDYAVSCDELDEITEAARSQQAVFGARLTGAGFGGCAIALVQPGQSEAVIDIVRQRYSRRFGVEPGFDLLRIGAGPGELSG